MERTAVFRWSAEGMTRHYQILNGWVQAKQYDILLKRFDELKADNDRLIQENKRLLVQDGHPP